MSAIPALTGRSSAEAFLVEHDLLQNELISVKEEKAALMAQLQEQAIRIDMIERERVYWRDRANLFFSYSIELTAALTSTIESVSTGLTRAKQIAGEITRAKLADAEADDGAAEVVQSMKPVRGACAELPNAFKADGQIKNPPPEGDGR